MKKLPVASITTVVAIAFLVLAACASRKEAPDPVKVQEEVAEYRGQEIDLIRSVVLDQERADRLLELLVARDRLIDDHLKEVAEYRERMVELNADYNAQRETFDELAASYNSQRATAQQEYIALSTAMKNETTANEWKKISKFQLKRLNPRRLIYSQASGGG